MTPRELKEVRKEMGLSAREFAIMLKLSSKYGANSVLRNERDDKASGLYKAAVQLLLENYRMKKTLNKLLTNNS